MKEYTSKSQILGKSNSKRLSSVRPNTKMSSIESQYGRDFGVRADKKLGNYLKDAGYRSLSDLLKLS